MSGWVAVADEQSKKLLFRYDPERELVELVQRGERKLIDLRDYKPGGRLVPATALAAARSAQDAGADENSVHKMT